MGSSSAASSGAPGVGDRLFPALGNGGYDAKHYDLGLSYGDGQDVPGAVRMRAVATQPLASQVLQVAVGDYETVRRGTVDGVEWRDLVATRKADIAEPTLAKLPAQLRWMEQRAGRYPFPSYGILTVDQDFHYALETQTLALHPVNLFDPAEYPQEFAEEIALHELAHMWYGDSVTIASYSDLWLAEGHATWYEQEYVAEFQGGDFEQYMRDEYAIADQLREESGPVARPKSNDPYVLFSDNVYGGGALVLFALHERIGDGQWRGLQREWAQRYAGRSVTTEDWIAFVNRYTGRNLTAFLRDWLYGTKTPPMPGHPDWETTNTSSASGRSSTATSSAPRANAFRP